MTIPPEIPDTVLLCVIIHSTPQSILHLSATCKLFNAFVTGNAFAQLKLRKYCFHKAPPDFEAVRPLKQLSTLDPLPPSTQVDRLIHREKNLAQLNFKITRFDVPGDRIISTAGSRVISGLAGDHSHGDRHVSQPHHHTGTTESDQLGSDHREHSRHLFSLKSGGRKIYTFNNDFLRNIRNGYRYGAPACFNGPSDVFVALKHPTGYEDDSREAIRNIHGQWTYGVYKLYNENLVAIPFGCEEIRVDKDWISPSDDSHLVGPYFSDVDDERSTVRIFDWRTGSLVGKMMRRDDDRYLLGLIYIAWASPNLLLEIVESHTKEVFLAVHHLVQIHGHTVSSGYYDRDYWIGLEILHSPREAFPKYIRDQLPAKAFRYWLTTTGGHQEMNEDDEDEGQADYVEHFQKRYRIRSNSRLSDRYTLIRVHDHAPHISDGKRVNEYDIMIVLPTSYLERFTCFRSQEIEMAEWLKETFMWIEKPSRDLHDYHSDYSSQVCGTKVLRTHILPNGRLRLTIYDFNMAMIYDSSILRPLGGSIGAKQEGGIASAFDSPLLASRTIHEPTTERIGCISYQADFDFGELQPIMSEHFDEDCIIIVFTDGTAIEFWYDFEMKEEEN